jgi:hypothetical protein
MMDYKDSENKAPCIPNLDAIMEVTGQLHNPAI